MKEIVVWKNFQKNYVCELRLANNSHGLGAYFNTWKQGYHSAIEGIDIDFIVYEYTGFPCGASKTDYCKDKETYEKYVGKCHSIEQLYEDAESFGFNREHVDAFINQEEKRWVYDDNGRLIEFNNGWSWNANQLKKE